MWISNSFLTLPLNPGGKFWFSNSEVLSEYLAIISSQIWDLSPADVSSCVNGVELCVGYDDVETQRIVWYQAKHCCLPWAKFELMLPKFQKLAHWTSPGKYRLQNNKSFSKRKFRYFCTSNHNYMSPLPFKSGKMHNMSTLQNSES